MVKDIIGNLLETNICHIIVHQANLFHTFGAGLARAILQKFPEAYEADKQTPHGDASKLGSYSAAKVIDAKGTSIRFIVNLYSQAGLGGNQRQTSYDAMVDALTKLRDKLEARPDNLTLGIPFQLGCGLANGDWAIVRNIIEVVFGKSRIPVFIYTLPEMAAK